MKFKTNIFILCSFRVISLLVSVLVLVLRALVSRHLLIGCTCSVSNCRDLEGSVQLVTRTRRPKQNTQILDVLGTWSVTEKDEKDCNGFTEQEVIESIPRRLDVVCHKKRRNVEKVIEQGVVETQQDFDGET